MVPETWHIVQRGADERGEWVWIDRHQGTRTTAWKLYLTDKGWRVFHIVFSKENLGLNKTPERLKLYEGHQGCSCHAQGIRLRGNLIDRTLVQLADASYA